MSAEMRFWPKADYCSTRLAGYVTMPTQSRIHASRRRMLRRVAGSGSSRLSPSFNSSERGIDGRSWNCRPRARARPPSLTPIVHQICFLLDRPRPHPFTIIVIVVPYALLGNDRAPEWRTLRFLVPNGTLFLSVRRRLPWALPESFLFEAPCPKSRSRIRWTILVGAVGVGY